MNEPKAICVDCGRNILQRTADRNDGRCEPCRRKVPVVIPDDFAIPREIAARLIRLNEEPEQYRAMAWQQGPDSLHSYIDMLEESHALYQEWAPRLRAFAAECREERPLPDEKSLAPSERAMQHIYREKLESEAPPGSDTSIAICSMPLIAMLVARRLWPQDDVRRVFLTLEEAIEWNEIYSHSDDALRWFSCHRWSIDDRPERLVFPPEEIPTWWNDDDLLEGESPWLVNVGTAIGPLYGWASTELWSWNGTQARFIKVAMKGVS